MTVRTHGLPPSAPKLLKAVVVRDVATASDPLLVRVESFGPAVSEAVSWPSIDPLPKAGEKALALIDETGVPWIVSFVRPTVTLAAATAASACRMAAQTLGVGTQAIGLDTAVSDPHGHFDLANHRYVVPATGLYQASGQVATLLNNNPQVTFVGLIKNGITATLLARGGRVEVRGGTTGDLWYLTVSALVPLTAGDHLELAAQNGGGNSQALEIVEPPGTNNYLSVFRVA